MVRLAIVFRRIASQVPMLSGKKFSAFVWVGTIGLLIIWWVVATRAPQQEWPMVFPLAACLLLALDLVNKGSRS